MPDTPRGYTYPTYGDTQDVPADIEELARDIDTDVQSVYDDVDAARNAPSASVSFAGPAPLATGVTTNWPFDTEQYDNAAMWSIGTPTIVNIPEDGIYLVTGWAQFAAPGASTNSVGVFLMTTPNGDYQQNTNPDHKRHYKRSELQALLASVFAGVQVEYAIAGGRARRYGLRSWGVRKPLQTALSIVSNAVNALESRNPELRNQPVGTHHLVARCHKA